MLLARRRLLWLPSVGLAFVSCNEETPPNTILPTPTSVIITPEAFLGDVACGTETGGLLAYQATLLDVTEGLQGAPTLPSSPVVDCTSTVVFETVQINHRYAAIVTAFDRSGLRAESEGSQTIVDDDGNPVSPQWATRCLGHDGEVDMALGGAGGETFDPDGEGGATNASLGVLAVEHAAVPVRGCEPLTGEFDPNLTGVRVELTSLLGSLTCGNEAGQVGTYTAELTGDQSSMGGMGGVGGGAPGERTACVE